MAFWGYKCGLAVLYIMIQSSSSINKMIIEERNQVATEEEPVRRSTRKRTQLKCDYYMMSMGQHEDMGDYLDEEDYSPRQNRKKRRGSEDFDQRVSRRKNLNRLVTLLDWKRTIVIPELPEEGAYRVHKVKNLFKTDLSKLATKVEGILINAKWSSDLSCRSNEGISVEDFSQLNLESTSLINNGLKTILHRIIQAMEDKGFTYVQNLQIVFLDLDKAQAEMGKLCSVPQKEKEKQLSLSNKKRSKLQTTSEDTANEENERNNKEDFLMNMDKLTHVDPNKLIMDKDSGLFKRSKLVLLMFRKFSSKKQSLQLRHQRNPDVLFDIVSPKSMTIDRTTKCYIYNMIQTLLPKAINAEGPLRLLQIWGNKDVPRRGWITVTDK